MAHGDVAVVAAQEDLVSLGEDAAVPVQPGVHRGLAAAGANGLYLGYGVCQLHEPPGAGEKAGEEVRAQAEARFRQILLVQQVA